MNPTKYVPAAQLRLARRFAELVERSSEFEIVAPTAPGVVTFRAAPDGLDGESLDALNADLRERVNATDEVFLSYTELRGRYVLRLVARCLPRVTDASRAWDVVADAFLGFLLDSSHPRLRWELLRAADPAAA